jgi:hypothetical protein
LSPLLLSDLVANPNPASAGTAVTVSFVIAAKYPVDWTASLSEAPSAGGSLNPRSGYEGNYPSERSTPTFTYRTERPTTATITIQALRSGYGEPKATPQSIVVQVQ